MRTLSSLAIVASFTTAALAQQVTLPAIFATTEGGTSANIWRAGTNRVQCFYDSTNFTTQGIGLPVTISGVEFRLAGAITPGTPNTYPSVEIYLQNSVANFQTPSTTFALNRTVAFPTTPNYAGAASAVAATGTTPNDFIINIPLTNPFVYDPSTGQDLLMEIVILVNPAPLVGHTLSTGFSNPAHLCNSVRSVGSTVAAAGTASPFCPVARFTYTPVPGAAFNTNIGAGCYNRARSFYEVFPSAANDLSGKTVTMTQNVNGGYDVTTAAGGVVVPPTGVGLALTDDQVSVALPLPFTFNYPGGSTASIVVDSNGSVLLNGTAASTIGGTAAALLSSVVHRLSPAMQDILPDGALNVANVYHNVDPTNPGVYLITWLNCPNFGAVVPTPSTFQVALIDNGTNDTVELRYQTLANDSSSNAAICITGFSLGNNAVDVGSQDLTAGLISTVPDQGALAIAGTTRPITNTTWNLLTSNIPPTGVLGIDVLGVSDPGIPDMAFIGMPGCGLRASLDLMNVYFPVGTTHAWSLALPNNPTLVGLSLYATGAMFTVPPDNTFGAITANATQGTIGTL